LAAAAPVPTVVAFLRWVDKKFDRKSLFHIRRSITVDIMERIKTPFGFSSTVDEVLQGIDLTGKRAIVTGGSSGIGIEMSR
jgi:hypothetical protein